MVDFFNKNNDEIDFEKIEFKINKSINERKTKFEDYNEDVKDFKVDKISNDENFSNNFMSNLTPYHNIKINRNISSHRPVVGNALIKIRKFLDDEIRRSVDPVIDKQIEFNMKMIEQVHIRFEEMNSRFEEMNSRFEEMNRRTDENMKQTNFNIKEIFRLRKMMKNGD